MQMVFVENNRLITDSLVVAEVFGKDHDKVLRDIRELECSIEFSTANFGESNYTTDRGRIYPKLNMTQDGFTFLVMGYTGKEAARYKELYISEFNRMRDELNKPKFQLPQTFTEALRLAADLSEENERVNLQNHQLLLQTTQQQEQLKHQEPRVAFANLVIAAGNTQPMGTVAKAVGMGRNNLFKFLRDKGIIMKNSTIPYQQFIDRGYFVVREVPTKRGDDQIINEPTARVTAKGLEYIAKLVLNNKGA